MQEQFEANISDLADPWSSLLQMSLDSIDWKETAATILANYVIAGANEAEEVDDEDEEYRSPLLVNLSQLKR